MSGKKGQVGWIAGFLFLIMISGLRIKAAESMTVSILQQVTREVDVKEEADEQSVTVGNLPEGTAVIVGDTEGSFCKITYQEIVGYIPNDALQVYHSEQVENLDREFATVEEESVRIIDEHELEEKDKHTSVLWGIVISFLVIGIFGTGIISALKRNREQE